MRNFLMLLMFSLSCSSIIADSRGFPPEPSKNAADSVSLLRVSQATDPRTPGGNPFRLRAKVETFEDDGKSVTGTYTLLWAAPNRWREEFSIADFQQTRVGGEGGVWETRSVPFIPFHLWQLSQALGSYARLELARSEKVGKIESKKLKGVNHRCVQIHWKDHAAPVREFCFATDSPRLVLEHYVPSHCSYLFSDYASIGTRSFPRRIRVFDGESLTAQLDAEDLQDSVQFDSLTFEHSTDSRWRPWCANPEPADHISPIYSLEIPGSGTATVYISFGTDGGIHDARILKSSGPKRDAQILDALKREKWEAPTCGGRPVEVETVALR
jgi:hypothetical protein